jgi:hypothetical protein
MALYLLIDPHAVFLPRLIRAVDPGELVLLFISIYFLVGIPVLIICGFAIVIMHSNKKPGLLALGSAALITLAIIRIFYIDVC